MTLTPEQVARLKAAAEKALSPHSVMDAHDYFADYNRLSGPAIILALLAQLEQSQDDYGQAVDSVAQLQEEVFGLRAQLEAAPAPSETMTDKVKRLQGDANRHITELCEPRRRIDDTIGAAPGAGDGLFKEGE
ncbi:MAG TPA: hypothetical protein VFW00_06535 [Rhodocyclaceae bacterium]|nr:hypothetical protein [Rhodocyclaceae bacterium]